jgi:hypothetical protein
MGRSVVRLVGSSVERSEGRKKIGSRKIGR